MISTSDVVVLLAGGGLILIFALITALGIWWAYRPKVQMHAGLYTQIPSRWRLRVLVWGFWSNYRLEDFHAALLAFDQALIMHKPEWRADFKNLMAKTYVQFHQADPQYGEGKRLAQLGWFQGKPIVAHGLAEEEVLHVVFEPTDHLENTAFLHEIGHRVREFHVGSYDADHLDEKMWAGLVGDSKRLFAEMRP